MLNGRLNRKGEQRIKPWGKILGLAPNYQEEKGRKKMKGKRKDRKKRKGKGKKI